MRMPESRDGTSARKPRGRRAAAPVATLSIKAIAARAADAKASAPKREATPHVRMEDALQEITTVAAAALHRSAAHSWAARAVACYRVCMAKTDHQQGLSYLYLGEHYREAALAHAAFGEAWRPMRGEVEAIMDADREAASAAMRQRSLADPAAKA